MRLYDFEAKTHKVFQTSNCIMCFGPFKGMESVSGGHVHLKNDMIIAIRCLGHKDDLDNGVFKHLVPRDGCIGCYGEYDERMGSLQEIVALRRKLEYNEGVKMKKKAKIKKNKLSKAGKFIQDNLEDLFPASNEVLSKEDFTIVYQKVFVDYYSTKETESTLAEDINAAYGLYIRIANGPKNGKK